MAADLKCKTCGGEMIQKNRGVMFAVGVGLAPTVGVALIWPLFWVPAIIGMLTGIYLIVWSTAGRGLWCRNCKKFSLF